MSGSDTRKVVGLALMGLALVAEARGAGPLVANEALRLIRGRPSKLDVVGEVAQAEWGRWQDARSQAFPETGSSEATSDEARHLQESYRAWIGMAPAGSRGGGRRGRGEPNAQGEFLSSAMGVSGQALQAQKPGLAARSLIANGIQRQVVDRVAIRAATQAAIATGLAKRVALMAEEVMLSGKAATLQEALTAAVETKKETWRARALRYGENVGLPTNQKALTLNGLFVGIVVAQAMLVEHQQDPDLAWRALVLKAVDQALTPDLLAGVVAYNLGSHYGKSAITEMVRFLRGNASFLNWVHVLQAGLKAGLAGSTPALATLASDTMIGIGDIQRSDAHYLAEIQRVGPSIEAMAPRTSTAAVVEIFEEHFDRGLFEATLISLDPRRTDYVAVTVEAIAGLVAGGATMAVTKSADIGTIAAWAAAKAASAGLDAGREAAADPRDFVHDDGIWDLFERSLPEFFNERTLAEAKGGDLDPSEWEGWGTRVDLAERAEWARGGAEADPALAARIRQRQAGADAKSIIALAKAQMDEVETLDEFGGEFLVKHGEAYKQLRAAALDLAAALIYEDLDRARVAGYWEQSWLKTQTMTRRRELGPAGEEISDRFLLEHLRPFETNYGRLHQPEAFPKRGLPLRRAHGGRATLVEGDAAKVFGALEAQGMRGRGDARARFQELVGRMVQAVEAAYPRDGVSILEPSTYPEELPAGLDILDQATQVGARNIWLNSHRTVAVTQAMHVAIHVADRRLAWAIDHVGGTAALPAPVVKAVFLYRELMVSRAARYQAATEAAVESHRAARGLLDADALFAAAEARVEGWLQKLQRGAGVDPDQVQGLEAFRQGPGPIAYVPTSFATEGRGEGTLFGVVE